MNAIKKFLVIAISGLAFTGCFDMTERPYTLLDASNYFTDENSIKQVIAHIYAQEQADLSEQYWYAQELSADQITWRSWNGGSWGWDSGDKFVLSTHTWNPMAFSLPCSQIGISQITSTPRSLMFCRRAVMALSWLLVAKTRGFAS